MRLRRYRLRKPLRTRCDRGATLVEGAVVAPLVMMLLFAVTQGAFLMRGYVSAKDASNAAARADSIASTDSDADYTALAAVKRSATALSSNAVIRVIVFKANSTSDSVPSQCLTGPKNGLCNYYTTADLLRPEADFSDPTWLAANAWPAASRIVAVSDSDGFIGVYVQVHSGGIGGPFPDLLDYSSVTRIQPTSY